jgi:hypothetical protein
MAHFGLATEPVDPPFVESEGAPVVQLQDRPGSEGGAGDQGDKQ